VKIFGIIYAKCGCSSVVERLLPKQDIVGSSPITRSSWERPSNAVILEKYDGLFLRAGMRP
jgi:hypothetical protein